MENEPVTWNESGKLVPLTSEEKERQAKQARRDWIASGSASIRGAQVVPLGKFEFLGVILRDIGELGMDAVPSAFRDRSPVVVLPTGWIFFLAFRIIFCVVLAVIVYPVSFVFHRIGCSIIGASNNPKRPDSKP